MTISKLVLFSVFLWTVGGLQMPPYLKPCERKDPKFNKCALKHGNDAIPYIVKGDRQYKIPNMSPFKISLIEVNSGKNFNIKMKDLEIWGLNRTKLLDIDMNQSKKTINLELAVDRLEIVGTYDMDAKILVLPLKGSGPANITLRKPVLRYFQEWGLKEREGEVYGYIVNSELSYEVERAIYNFENLFKGNDQLGIETNRILNDNWGVVHSDLSSPVGKTIASVMDSILSNVYELIPYKYMFV